MTKYEQLKKLIQDANPGIFKCTSRGCMLAPCFLADHRREIRLADVLLAMKKKHHLAKVDIYGVVAVSNQGNCIWNLKENFDNQSDECKEFLIKLLIK